MVAKPWWASFRATDLWPDYQGSPKDVIEADIYDHWLETMG